jgi:hypothetical protein
MVAGQRHKRGGVTPVASDAPGGGGGNPANLCWASSMYCAICHETEIAKHIHNHIREATTTHSATTSY